MVVFCSCSFIRYLLLQVKELGAVVYNCSCLAADLGKIFETYWFVGESQSIPSQWPSSFSTDYNKDTPLQLLLNNTPASVYLSVCLDSLVPSASSSLHLLLLSPLPSEFTPVLLCHWQDV